MTLSFNECLGLGFELFRTPSSVGLDHLEHQVQWVWVIYNIKSNRFGSFKAPNSVVFGSFTPREDLDLFGTPSQWVWVI